MHELCYCKLRAHFIEQSLYIRFKLKSPLQELTRLDNWCHGLNST